MEEGYCGENLTWKLNDNGLLTISGTGDMKNFSFKRKSPWNDQRKLIKKIIIEDNVTSIGCWAFSGCSELEKVTISNSVTKIGRRAFYNCSIISITIPEVSRILAEELSAIVSN